MCFGGASNFILPGLFYSHSTNKTCNAMEEECKYRSEGQDFYHNSKEAIEKCQTEKKAEWLETCK